MTVEVADEYVVLFGPGWWEGGLRHFFFWFFLFSFLVVRSGVLREREEGGRCCKGDGGKRN